MDYQNRILLLMKYDNNKTLTENKQTLLTESTITPITRMLRSLVTMADETLSKVINKTKPEIETLLRKRNKTTSEIDEIFNSIQDFKSLANLLFKKYGLFSETQLNNTVKVLTDQVGADSTKYSKIVNGLSDSLLNTLNLPNSAKPLIDEYSILIRQQIKQRLKVDYPDVYKQLFKVKGLFKKLTKAESKNLKPKTIKWWERVLSTDKTVFDLGKGWLDDAANRILLWRKGEQKYIDELFAKLQKITEDSIDYYKRGEQIDLSQYRNINTNIRVLADKNKANLDAIYDDLGELLKSKYPDNGSEINDIIEQVKKNNPFKSGRLGALTQFLSETSSSKYIENIRKMLVGPEKLKNFEEFGQRTISIMATGMPKTYSEWGAYLSKGTPGLVELWKDLWIALHVGMPMALAAGSTALNMLGIVEFGNPTGVKGPIQDWFSRWMSYYGELFNGWSKYEIILPVHPYGWEIYKFSKDIYAEKYTAMLDKAFISELEKLSDIDLSKYEGYDRTKSRIENIRNIAKIVKERALEEIKNKKIIPSPPTPTPAPNNDVKIMNDFKNYIISTWGNDYKEGNVDFSKEGEYYVVSDKSVNMKYLYKYNNNTFEYVEQ